MKAEAVPGAIGPARRAERRAFNRLLVGEGLSGFGSQLSLAAIPSYAVLVLGSSPREIALLQACELAPPVLLALLAGRFADQSGRRRTMIVADGVAAASAGLAALLMWRDALGLPLLGFLVFVIGAAATIYSLGSAALVPRLLAPDERVTGIARLTAARAFSDTAGQIVAARLLAFAAVPLTLALDAVSYAARALLVRSIRASADVPAKVPQGAWEGWVVVRSSQLLLRLFVSQAAFNLGGAFVLGYFWNYAYTVLRVSPWQVALMLAVGKVCGFATALVFPMLAGCRTLEWWCRASLVTSAAALWLLIAASKLPALPTLFGYQAVFSASATVFVIAITALRQHATPQECQGRVAAFAFTLSYSSMLAGAGFAALAASFLGLTAGVAAGCALTSLSVFALGRPELARAR